MSVKPLYFLIALLLLALVPIAWTTGREAEVPVAAAAGGEAAQEAGVRGEEAAAVAVVQAFLDALRAKDPEALAATMMPDGVIHSVNMGSGRESQPIRGRTAADDVASIATTRAALLERIWEPEVRVHGRVAVVWTPYDFWTDGRFSHCGVDVFTLLKALDGWKISSIAYTVEPEGCLPSPLGAPTPEQLGVP